MNRKLFFKNVARLVSLTNADYSIFTEKSPYLQGQDMVLVQRSPSIWRFVLLVPYQKDPTGFFIEMGWSRLLRFPQRMRPLPNSLVDINANGDLEGIVRALREVGRGDQVWKCTMDPEYVAEFIRTDVLPYLLTFE